MSSLVNHHPINSTVLGVTMAGQEVESGTTTTLSCKMTDVTNALTVTWLKTTGETINSGGEFTVSPGLHITRIILIEQII